MRSTWAVAGLVGMAVLLVCGTAPAVEVQKITVAAKEVTPAAIAIMANLGVFDAFTVDADASQSTMTVGSTGARFGGSYLEMAVQEKFVPKKKLAPLGERSRMEEWTWTDVAVRVPYKFAVKGTVVATGTADGYADGGGVTRTPTGGGQIRVTATAKQMIEVERLALADAMKKINAQIKAVIADKVFATPANDRGFRPVKVQRRGDKLFAPLDVNNRLPVAVGLRVSVWLPGIGDAGGGRTGPKPLLVAQGEAIVAMGEKKAVEIELPSDREKEFLSKPVIASADIVLTTSTLPSFGK
jgi:hypothetical protein